MATWVRHAYPGEMVAADRLAWYNTIGIKDLFASITQDDTSNNGTDVFKTVDSSATAVPSITLRYMKADYTVTNMPTIYTAYIGSPQSNMSRSSPSGGMPESTSPLYIDTLVHGNLTLVRFTYEYARNNATFIFYNDDNIDGDTVSVVIGGCVYGYSITTTSWKAYFDQSGIAYNHKSSGVEGTYFNETNRTFCNKVVVTPLAMKGCDMGLYLLDGGNVVIPYNTDFVVDNTHFYHIGYGLCLKITS